MNELKIAPYPDAYSRPLSEADQRAILISLKRCLDNGIPFGGFLQNNLAIEECENTIKVWSYAIHDFTQNGTSPHEALVKTGFFSNDINRILLVTNDIQTGVIAVVDYLRLPRR